MINERGEKCKEEIKMDKLRKTQKSITNWKRWQKGINDKEKRRDGSEQGMKERKLEELVK